MPETKFCPIHADVEISHRTYSDAPTCSYILAVLLLFTTETVSAFFDCTSNACMDVPTPLQFIKCANYCLSLGFFSLVTAPKDCAESI